MKNKQVKQSMEDVANHKNGINGYKDIATKGWHGFDESGLFHCSGSNFLWLYDGVVVSLDPNGQPVKR